MNPTVGQSLASLRWAARWLLLTFALAFPIVMAADAAGFSQLHFALPLVPSLVWKGQLWRLISYSFLPAGIVDWFVSLFWLTTLVLVVGKNWSGRTLWIYCLLTALGGALPIVLLSRVPLVVGNGAMAFGLLVAWERIYGRERILLLGLGEMSVRQAAICVAIINLIILWFCQGPFVTFSMLCGGVAGWLYFTAGMKRTARQSGRTVESGRITRLEL
jgi:membrane associated rhomboid family serine protease